MGRSLAPLQAFVRSTRGVFATLLCFFSAFKRSSFWVARRPRILASGVLEYRSIRVLRFPRFAPRDREVGGTFRTSILDA
jgi:hypothetical protein